MSIVVFGGNGFVGQQVLKALVAKGEASLVSISRSGVVPKNAEAEAWAGGVTWARGDAMDAATYDEVLAGAKAVVVAVGSPPVPGVDEAWQTMVNGQSNCTVISAAKAAGVPQVVLVNATTPAWCPPGYKKGKEMAEACAEEFVNAAYSVSAPGPSTPAGALVLKPGAIYGTRHTAGGLPIPLAPVLAPVSWGIKLLQGPVAMATKAAPYLLEGALVPPVSVEALAAVAADGCVSGEYAGKLTVLDAFQLTA